MINIQDNSETNRFALFDLAFRPFFLLSSLVASVGLLVWIFYYSGWYFSQTYWNGSSYHSHEMIYGFVMGIVAGFLLTAARVWTSRETVSGVSLILLVILWLLGRIAPWTHWPGLYIAIIDLSFLPIVIFYLAKPIVQIRQWRNIGFIPILLLMWSGNLLMHLQHLGITQWGAHRGLYLGVDVILLLIVVMGGRVIPMFSGNGIGVNIPRTPTLDKLCIFSTLIFIVLHQMAFQGWGLFAAALLAFIIQSYRSVLWYRNLIWTAPLVWILQLSYIWILTGFLLTALASLNLISPFLALHAMTVGGMSGMILGMIARVSLGHTGRPLQPSKVVVVSFYLLQLSALIRVFLPLLMPDFTAAAVIVSGFLWALAFVGFVVSYFKILIRPKVTYATAT